MIRTFVHKDQDQGRAGARRTWRRPGGGPRRGWGVIIVMLALTSCQVADVRSPESDLYPLMSVSGGRLTFESGPGALATTSDESWGGQAAISYPAAVDADSEPVEVHVLGLDLSQIEYTGDMGWPPDPTDKGALVRVSLAGNRDITYRIWSSLAGIEAPELPEPVGVEPRRAYRFHGYLDNSGAYGIHNFQAEPWRVGEDPRPYNTFDLRLRYSEGVVEAWVRLHASGDWEGDGRQRGAECPSNVAKDNALPGTADMIWEGECRPTGPGETGRPVGAWVPVEGGPWTAGVGLGSVRVRLSISNWEHAEGPYRVAWSNVLLEGPADSEAATAAGRGTFRPFGTGTSKVESRGEPAQFSFFATSPVNTALPRAMLRYRSPVIDLITESTSWVVIAPGTVSFGGTAMVDGVSGFRYELTAVDAGDAEADSLGLEVWSPVSTVAPHHLSFGSLASNAVEIQIPGLD